MPARSPRNPGAGAFAFPHFTDEDTEAQNNRLLSEILPCPRSGVRIETQKPGSGVSLLPALPCDAGSDRPCPLGLGYSPSLARLLTRPSAP